MPGYTVNLLQRHMLYYRDGVAFDIGETGGLCVLSVTRRGPRLAVWVAALLRVD